MQGGGRRHAAEVLVARQGRKNTMVWKDCMESLAIASLDELLAARDSRIGWRKSSLITLLAVLLEVTLYCTH